MSELPGEGRRAVLARMVEAAPDGVLLADGGGTILWVNHQLGWLFGYPREELVGQSVELLIPGDLWSAHRDRRTGLSAHPITGPMGSGLALVGQRRDSTEFPVEISLSPMETAEGVRTIAIVRGATVQAEADLRLMEKKRDLAVMEDRQRIARDLHGRVVQRLFAAGMEVESILGRTTDPVVRDRLHRAVREIDASIADVRSSVFELTPPRAGGSLPAQVLELCAEMRAALGLEPNVRFVGPVEAVDAGICAAVLAVIREALSNVARHAKAQHVALTVSAGERIGVELEVDGTGLAASAGSALGRGLRNMEARARELRGTFEIGANGSSGTRLAWRVPTG